MQKQAIAQKLNLVSEELNEKSYAWEEAIRQKETNYEAEVKRVKGDGQRYKEEVDMLREENKRYSLELDNHRNK